MYIALTEAADASSIGLTVAVAITQTGCGCRWTEQRRRSERKAQIQMVQMTVGSCEISSTSVNELHRH